MFSKFEIQYKFVSLIDFDEGKLDDYLCDEDMVVDGLDNEKHYENLESFDISNDEDISYMFDGCSNLENLTAIKNPISFYMVENASAIFSKSGKPTPLSESIPINGGLKRLR